MQEIAVIIVVAVVVFMARNFMVKQEQLDEHQDAAKDNGERVLDVKANVVDD